MIPFIKKHHKIDEVVFWPDMASSHYSKIVTSHLKLENVEFVARNENAPNVPHLRPIEKFWAICKQEYKKLQNPQKIYLMYLLNERKSAKRSEKNLAKI